MVLLTVPSTAPELFGEGADLVGQLCQYGAAGQDPVQIVPSLRGDLVWVGHDPAGDVAGLRGQRHRRERDLAGTKGPQVAAHHLHPAAEALIEEFLMDARVDHGSAARSNRAWQESTVSVSAVSKRTCGWR